MDRFCWLDKKQKIKNPINKIIKSVIDKHNWEGINHASEKDGM